MTVVMKLTSFRVCVILLLLVVSYCGLEQTVFMKMSSDLKHQHGDDYAVLSLNMGGEEYLEPSLWRMLKFVYAYNFTDDYLPQNSGGITGKKYYLTMLLSDNKTVSTYNWSFRHFRLDHSPINPEQDIISNLPEKIAEFYKFDKKSRIKRKYLWCSSNSFNNENVRFYMRNFESTFKD